MKFRIKRVVKSTFPALYPHLVDNYFRLQTLIRIGSKHKCPCCGWSFRTFLSGGIKQKRANATCPRCRSFERHRWLWLYLELYLKQQLQLRRPLRILHMAPASAIARRLAGMEGVAYVPVDLGDDDLFIAAKMDITQLAFSAERFDLIICLHVLEHVDDDIGAMRELHRVIAHDGQAIIAVPAEMSRTTTYEDPTIVSAEGRFHAFHQEDHVRVYGRDIVNRLEEAGFQVTVERVSDLDQQTIDRYGLWDEEMMFICKKG